MFLIRKNTDIESDLHDESKKIMELKIAAERFRQAQYSFNLALLIMASCTCISVAGLGLLLAGRIAEGAITATSGISTIVPCVNFAREANDRLDNILTSTEES